MSSPAEAECFADTEACVGEQLEQRLPAGVCGREHATKLVAFEDGDLDGRPEGFLARFELADGVGGEPATANGEAADLVERDQDDQGCGGGECLFVGL